MKSKNRTTNLFFYSIISIIFLLLGTLLYNVTYIEKENFEIREERVKAFYINLDKNTKRNNDFQLAYKKSDFHNIGLTRFPAILGKNVKFDMWLTPEAIKELNETELTKQRTHHYQLTYGGVGCFLSHYTLAKQLLEDDSVDYYIVFEDDISFQKNTLKPINYYLSIAPEDWDIIQFGNTRKINCAKYGQFYKPTGFWGHFSYIINKKGARKIVDEVEREKIDGQIDAYLSRMIQQNKINIYITSQHIIRVNKNNNISNIQYRLKRSPSHVNPYNYKGYIV